MPSPAIRPPGRDVDGSGAGGMGEEKEKERAVVVGSATAGSRKKVSFWFVSNNLDPLELECFLRLKLYGIRNALILILTLSSQAAPKPKT